jgi:glutamyl-tRNA synthetase
VGTARTALFNELFARHHQGSFIVRIEDTDRERSKPEFEANILEGLRWLGLEWQEGPDVGGAYGPYRQSERGEWYAAALQQLLASGKAYFCNCQAGQECQCKGKQNELKASGNTDIFAIRLAVEPQDISFVDAVRGKVSIHTDSFGGDFIVARSLTEPLYHVAVVIDDAAMKITHVIRGEDHVSNTPKHILLQRALGYETPAYAHVPLLLDKQRRKLSKRALLVDLLAYRDTKGYLPQTMVNYLALLGWNPKTDQEFFTHQELTQHFTLAGVQKGGAIFDTVKLDAMNRHYISRLSPAELLVWGKRYFRAGEDEERFVGALQAEQGRISGYEDDLAERISWHAIDWAGERIPRFRELLSRKGKLTETTVADRLAQTHQFLAHLPAGSFHAALLEKKIIAWIDEKKLGRLETLWPLRVALTGREHSPGPFQVAAVLGKEETMKRIERAGQMVHD